MQLRLSTLGAFQDSKLLYSYEHPALKARPQPSVGFRNQTRKEHSLEFDKTGNIYKAIILCSSSTIQSLYSMDRPSCSAETTTKFTAEISLQSEIVCRTFWGDMGKVCDSCVAPCLEPSALRILRADGKKHWDHRLKLYKSEYPFFFLHVGRAYN